MHAFPLVPSCHRNCNDCGLHPGWTNTTGTQCGVTMELSGGNGVRFRLWQSKPNATLADPLGMGLDYVGAEWTLTATLLDTRRGHGADGRTRAALALAAAPGGSSAATATVAEPIVVGKMFLQDTYAGIGRMSAFHEHIGCTPCGAFYESEVRGSSYLLTAISFLYVLAHSVLAYSFLLVPRLLVCQLGAARPLGRRAAARARGVQHHLRAAPAVRVPALRRRHPRPGGAAGGRAAGTVPHGAGHGAASHRALSIGTTAAIKFLPFAPVIHPFYALLAVVCCVYFKAEPMRCA